MTTAELLKRDGMNVRKYRLRESIAQDRARKNIALAREEGLNDGEIRAALGFTVAEYNQLRGTA